MNYEDDNPDRNLTMADVSVAYRAAASETTPAALDRKILREAANEVKNTDEARWSNGWLRPLTFVATLGLSIALLLELSEYQVFDPPNGMEMNGMTVAPAEAPNTSVGGSSVSDNPEADDGQGTRIEADTVVPAQSSFERAEADSVQPGSATAPAPPQSRADPAPLNRERADTDAFREAADAAAKQVREVGASAGAKLQEMPETGPTTESAIAVPGAIASDVAAERQQCADNRRITPEEWWLCIVELRTAGHQEEAELELQQLQDTFPRFSPQQ